MGKSKEIVCNLTEFYFLRTGIHNLPGFDSWLVCAVACNEILGDCMSKNKIIQSQSLTRMAEQGPSIIYAPTRKEAESVAKFLCQSGLKAAPYHAKLAKGHLRRAHEQFHLGTLQVIVATIAFGMGIDKPDVRHIIHYGWPQEAGRAGRDGLPSECMLYCDMTTLPSLLPSRRDQEQIQHALHMLDQCFRYGLSTSKCRANTLLQYFGENLATAPCEIRRDDPGPAGASQGSARKQELHKSGDEAGETQRYENSDLQDQKSQGDDLGRRGSIEAETVVEVGRSSLGSLSK
ncbi:hypothetical protein L7F22_056430 [Adiantum nelumboides]|nr:hypothetical protein [Adiantum nelumboides]